MKPIAVFYHCLFFHGDPPEFSQSAFDIVLEQMDLLKKSGLQSAASEIIVGINGDEESREIADWLLPKKSKKVYHGLNSRAENLTIVEIEKWAPSHPNWNVLYFHAKGATHASSSDYAKNVSSPWRQTMMGDLVLNWNRCVHDLDDGNDIVCSRWLWNMADGSQHIPAGNFLWVKSSFVARLPSIFLRERIKVSGIGHLESRYESEVYWGNGPKPNVKHYRLTSGGGIP